MNGKQLKNSILQWAIQGKLVPQDPNDEPASVLLDKIRQEKERLIKEKKIKRDKNASIIYRGEDNSYYEKILATGEVKCIDEEIPFDVPVGWEWCRLGELISYQNGYAYTSSELNKECKGMPVIKSGNLMTYEVVLKANNDYVEKPSTKMLTSVINKGDLLMCLSSQSDNPEPLGKTAIYKANTPALLNQRVLKMRPWLAEMLEYMYYVINSEYFHYTVSHQGGGSAQANLKLGHVLSMLVPLAPLEEEVRIVDKITAIMPLVLQYETTFLKQEKLNIEINNRLKSSILQEAIQGKLVPQIAEEGSAQELLEQIKEEKRKLVREGKLKKSALNDSVIFRGDDNKYYEQIGANCNDITDEIPFDLPYNWCWCRFSNIVSMTIGKTPARGEQTYWINGKYNWVSISDMVDGDTISTTKEKVSDLAVKEIFSAPISEKGSLLMSFKLSIGKTSILDIDAYHNEAIITIRPVIDKKYAMRNYLFKVLPLIANLGDSKDAIKGKTLNSKSLANLLIPLPPLQEQQRIIERINLLSKQLR
ncbi:restriction endonuclease subunit S [Alistipes putredinis]|uniref:restriction endonuclease subunit S n=1 Tax=Alistipes putredinis TaxID=28117 RepID=UPI003AB63C26